MKRDLLVSGSIWTRFASNERFVVKGFCQVLPWKIGKGTNRHVIYANTESPDQDFAVQIDLFIDSFDFEEP